MKFSLLVALPLIFPLSCIASDLDEKLRLVKEVYQLQEKNCSTLPIEDATYIAGKALFESKSLSGDRNISCADCHIDKFGTADGLPIAVGVGGEGEGTNRYHSPGVLVQRNAFSLRGRADTEFVAFFWDGKAQLDGDRLVTQFGDGIPDNFESLLSIAAILPLVERDEFIGKSRLMSSNDVQYSVKDQIYLKRYIGVSNAIRERLVSPETLEDTELSALIEGTGKDLGSIDLSDIGNLLAKFIAKEFPCKHSAWDQYLGGDLSALTESQKSGALIFFGKGRCASCHSGKFHSDFRYHSIGTPQGYFGPNSRHRDLGRAAVTHRASDRFLFRTPPLNDVSETAPYGHNGAFSSLKEAVTHHFNPLEFYINNPSYYEADFFRISHTIDSRDTLLREIDIRGAEELEHLLDFLNAL